MGKGMTRIPRGVWFVTVFLTTLTFDSGRPPLADESTTGASAADPLPSRRGRLVVSMKTDFKVVFGTPKR